MKVTGMLLNTIVVCITAPIDTQRLPKNWGARRINSFIGLDDRAL